jgi:hypothetical protein
MKSFFALALLGAVASADQAADAAAKKAIVDAKKYGVTEGPHPNTLTLPDWTLDGGKGVVKMWSGWKRTEGTDSRDVFNFMWTVEPSATYKPFESVFDFMFATDKYTKAINYTRFSRANANNIAFQSYNYTKLSRSVDEFTTGNGLLTPAETSALNGSKYAFFWDATGKFTAPDKMESLSWWTIDPANSSYSAANGAMTICLTRDVPGVEDVKIGGATYVGYSFKDGSTAATWKGDYVKWADLPSANTGATALTTYAAIAVAAIAALF